MGDFIELGLEGADKLIDKHFDKVPDKYIHADTYKPKRMRKGSKDQQSDNNSQSQSQSQSQSRHSHKHARRPRSTSPPYSHYPGSSIDMDGRPRNNANSSPYLQDGPFVTPPVYSSHPPHQRPEYTPSPPPIGTMNTYQSPRDLRRYDDSPPRRPTGRRRSSSYHGRRDDDYFDSSEDDERQLSVRHPHRRGSHTDIGGNSKDKTDRHDLKHEVRNQFTKSKEGIAGGVVGALVGGWAAHKALESRGKDRGNGDGDAALTLLGAAVGGLAINAVVDKWEDRKEVTKEKQERWEEKWDGDDRGSRSKGSSRPRQGSRYDDDQYYR